MDLRRCFKYHSKPDPHINYTNLNNYYLYSMKITLQQFKPGVPLYLLGLLSLVVLITDTGWLIACYVFGKYYTPLAASLVLRSIVPAFIVSVLVLQVKKSVLDLDKKEIKTAFHILGIGIPLSTKPLPKIDYVSVFCQLHLTGSGRNIYRQVASHTYDINLWYGPRHIKLCSQYSAEEALGMARQVAEALNCGLLDATDPHDKVWLIPE